MNGYRILSATFLGIGVISTFSGLQQNSFASCDEEMHYSSKCLNAHDGPPVENGSTPYCEWENNQCGPASGGSGCDDKYGVGYSGRCLIPVIGTEDDYNCFQDAFQTFIYIPWYSAECVQNNAECNCEWTETSTRQIMSICDCYDEEVEW